MKGRGREENRRKEGGERKFFWIGKLGLEN
jgi:hypothetical protein